MGAPLPSTHLGASALQNCTCRGGPLRKASTSSRAAYALAASLQIPVKSCHAELRRYRMVWQRTGSPKTRCPNSLADEPASSSTDHTSTLPLISPVDSNTYPMLPYVTMASSLSGQGGKSMPRTGPYFSSTACMAGTEMRRGTLSSCKQLWATHNAPPGLGSAGSPTRQIEAR